MLPIPDGVKSKMLGWLPKTLAGYTYPLKETDNIEPDLIAPAITFYVSDAGGQTDYSWTILRTVRNSDGILDDYWGGYHNATMNVVLRAYDKAELSQMWESFIRQCLKTRRDLLLRRDRVRFIEILNSVPLEPSRLPNGQTLYWAQVDLRFEYEVSEVSDEDPILRAHTDIDVRGSHFEFDTELFIKELTVGIVAYIAPST